MKRSFLKNVEKRVLFNSFIMNSNDNYKLYLNSYVIILCIDYAAKYAKSTQHRFLIWLKI
jgi:hypothetical protein